ncbi:OmpA family protein [Altibacter lentus]|uniref:OmpA family protein n=1 Tax=Altibacter lentus TaxID=1223410 RepID=UPI00055223B7|nr:OmpA family protein [Altibacter lentus]
MKNFLIAFAVFLVWSFFGLWLYFWLQPGKETAKANLNPTAEQQENKTNGVSNDLYEDLGDSILPIQSIKDSIFVTQENQKEISEAPSGLKAISNEGDIIFLFPEGITITKNSALLKIPPSAVDFKYKLNTYLLEHPNREIHISSQYSASEDIQSPNLGIQRGQQLKEILIKTGIPSERIVIKPHIKSIEFDNNNTFSNSFTFFFKPLDTARINELTSKIPESRIAYPNFTTTGILVNENLRTLLAEVVTIVKQNPDIQMEVVGHTDNVGNANDNYILGLQYARQVRWYLINKGDISPTKIKAVSKGEAEPLDTNRSDAGRDANRRVEVKFYLDK